MVRAALLTVVLALSALAPLAWHTPSAGADPGGMRHWMCVGEKDVDIGVCINNPLPPWPFTHLGSP